MAVMIMTMVLIVAAVVMTITMVVVPAVIVMIIITIMVPTCKTEDKCRRCRIGRLRVITATVVVATRAVITATAVVATRSVIPLSAINTAGERKGEKNNQENLFHSKKRMFRNRGCNPAGLLQFSGESLL